MNDPQPNSPDSTPEPPVDAGASADSHTAAERSSDADASGSRSTVDSAFQQQMAELQDRLLRAHADLENYRRRSHKDLQEARKYESLRLVHDLLPGLDGLERAVASAEQTGNLQNLLEGIRMVSQQFRDVLKAHAAEPIEALGQPFDPNQHEALSQIPSADCEPMTVLQVVELGYRLHDRIVRPARVIVSCAPPESSSVHS